MYVTKLNTFISNRLSQELCGKLQSRMAEVLTRSQLQRLIEHKYSAEGCSLLEPKMQIFWRWLVEQVPLWWAPNAITLIGLIMNVASVCVMVYYSPDARQEV